MLATAGDPEALYHSIEANRLARNFLEQNQESDAIAEVFYLSQEILRKAQAEASAARGRPAVTQQAANVGPANVPSRPASRRIRSSFRGPRPPPARSTRKSSYTAEDGTKWECTPTLRTIKEEEE